MSRVSIASPDTNFLRLADSSTSRPLISVPKLSILSLTLLSS